MKTAFLALFGVMLTSCISNSKIINNYPIMQIGLDTVTAITYSAPTIKPFDALSILVYSKTTNQDQAAIFNVSMGVGKHENTSAEATSDYVVDENGYIIMPMIEKVPVWGLTLDSLRILLKQKLKEYIKEVDVIARFSSYKINVMGEVNKPGIVNVPHQRNNLLDIISLSGGLTDLARRDSVVILREEFGKLHKYIVDLRNAQFVHSNVYQLQQNDIVYVLAESNKLKNVAFASDVALKKVQYYAMFAQLILIPLTIYNIIRR